MGDYDYCMVKGHHSANKKGLVLKHRVIMENYLERPMDNQEIVHHIDGDKRNNSIDNLELMLRGEHSKHHNSERSCNVELKCPWCGTIFPRVKSSLMNDLKRNTKFQSCSKRCANLFHREILKHGIDSEYIQNQLNENRTKLSQLV